MFEDSPQDPGARRRWTLLSGKEPPKDLPSTFAMPDVPMIRVGLVVRAADSGRALLREAIRLGNAGEVARGLATVELAKQKLLLALNLPLAARAVQVAEELQIRRQLVNDKTLRRLDWLQRQVRWRCGSSAPPPPIIGSQPATLIVSEFGISASDALGQPRAG